MNGIQWSWVEIRHRRTFSSYFKESVSGEYHIYQLIPLHSCDYLKKTSIKVNMATEEGKQLNGNVTLNKRWNWSSCTKLALNGSWTHDLIVQLVRASEQNSVAVASNPTEANLPKLLQRICQWWIPYVSIYSATLMWLLTKNFDENKRED